jgi:hypothetical protein
MHRLVALLIVGLAALAQAQTVSPTADDVTVVPGKRVGPITAYSSLRILQSLFGKAQVQAGKVPGAEGETLDGAVIKKGTDQELQIVWQPEAVGKRIASVRVMGRAWKFENGLRLGLTVSEVEAINGKPFKISGFDWDYGGYASFEGGTLVQGVSVRFRPSVENYSKEIVGEKQLASTSAALRAANPLVSELTVMYAAKP